MGNRGPRSSADRATKPVLAISTARPSPPAELTEAEAAVWRAVVDAQPADWFRRSTWPLLIAYCRHVVRAEILAAEVVAFQRAWLAGDGGLERFGKLLGFTERETRALTACARALRLTPQSQMHPRTIHAEQIATAQADCLVVRVKPADGLLNAVGAGQGSYDVAKKIKSRNRNFSPGCRSCGLREKKPPRSVQIGAACQSHSQL